MDYFETELERVQIAYMCALRADSADWTSGQDLAQGATAYLNANFEAMQAAIDHAE